MTSIAPPPGTPTSASVYVLGGKPINLPTEQGSE